MTAEFKFDLKDIEDKYAFKRHSKAFDMALAIYEILNIKNALDHSDMSDEKALEFIFSRIAEILEKYNIAIDELIL